jgi:hypothetical protein
VSIILWFLVSGFVDCDGAACSVILSLLRFLLLCNLPCRLQVDYEFNASTGALDILHGKEHFMPNLSMLLQWSPFSTEAELLKQVSSFKIFFLMLQLALFHTSSVCCH